MFTTFALTLTLMLGVAVGGVTAPASATWNDPKVNVSGHIDCGGIDSAAWVWYQTSNGERGWANIEDWTAVSRWTSIAGRWLWVKVKTYRVNLTNVPRNGTTLTLTVGCHGALGGSYQWPTSFGVNRPTFGRGATRHICRNAMLGCWV
jgi:hypothetical protein